MRCCEAWKPIENCFDLTSFESVDFQRLSQIIANFTREDLGEREAEITNLPWTQTEKDNALARCRIGQHASRTEKTCFVSALSQMKRATPWKTMMNQAEGFMSNEDPFSKHVSKDRDITNMRISCGLFRWLLTTSVGPLIVPSLTNSLLGRKIQNISLKVGRSVSPRLLTLMTMEELFDLQTRFGH